MFAKLQSFMISLCQDHIRLYIAGYLGSYFFLLIMVSFLPYFFHSLTFPIFYDKLPYVGAIEEKKVDTVSVPLFIKRYRLSSYDSYFFVIDQEDVPVTNRIYHAYREGEYFPCYIYQNGNASVYSRHNYHVLTGILGFLAALFSLGTALCFTLIETNASEIKKAEQRKENMREFSSERKKYKEYTAKELYELCLSKKLKIIPGKRQNRRYLEHCLMQEQMSCAVSLKYAQKEKRAARPLHLLLGIAWLCVILSLAKHFYYLIGMIF